MGIPGGFDGGANGITFSDLSIDFQNVPGPVGNFTIGTSLAGLGIVPGEGPIPGLPFGVGETPLLLFAATVEFASLNIELNTPFSSALTEDPASPGQYLWAGPADVTLTGEFKPSISVSPENPAPIPFSIPVAAFPLLGSFSAGRDGSEVVVGLDVDGLDDLIENQQLSPDPVGYQIEVPVSALGIEEALGDVITALQIQAILDELGDSVLVDISLSETLAFDANLFEIHYTNATPVPEPGTAALVGVGFAVLGAARRRRSASR